MRSPKTGSRKERKQARKSKQQWSSKKLDELAWEIAKAISFSPRKENEGAMHFCKVCKMYYCPNSGPDMFCHECHYERGCLKRKEDDPIFSTCDHCQKGA